MLKLIWRWMNNLNSQGFIIWTISCKKFKAVSKGGVTSEGIFNFVPSSKNEPNYRHSSFQNKSKKLRDSDLVRVFFFWGWYQYKNIVWDLPTFNSYFSALGNALWADESAKALCILHIIIEPFWRACCFCVQV